jgi:hypothetical protein
MSKMMSEAERQEWWDCLMELLRDPGKFRSGVSWRDSQVAHDLEFRVTALLEFQAVLPAGLAAMLRGYLPEVADKMNGRWEGAGARYATLRLCDGIERDIAAGKWKPGDRLHSGAYDGRLNQPAMTLHRAMEVLAARGEVTVREDGYYVRGLR